MRYSDDLIEEIRMKNDIVDVISGYVKLQKKGSSYFGLCPFHNEKSPSFSVSPGKQMYYCFGCGAGGNVITFIMEYENFTFMEAVKFLADRAGVRLPELEYSREAKEQADLKATLLEINKVAASYFYYKLRQDTGRHAYEYLTGRGLTKDTIQKFGLGYSDRYSNDLYQYLKGKKYSDEVLRESGLFNVDEKRGMYDKFWNRVIFPIMDVNNRVIGFGGRVMGEGKPKYLNSPETKVFDKSRNLYGLNTARTSRRKQMILCEGYMDVIAMHQAGFTNAVASLGTAFTAQQANLLKRYTDEVLLLYDSDEAGVKAALRAIPILKAAGLTSKVVNLNPHKDPDEFIKNLGPEAFQKRLDDAMNSFLFEVQVLEKQYDMSDPQSKTRFYHEVAGKLLNFPEELERNNYMEAVSRKYGVRFEDLQKLVNRLAMKGTPAQDYVRPKSGSGSKEGESGIDKAQRLMLTWLVSYPDTFRVTEPYIGPDDFTTPLYHTVAELLYEQYHQGEVNPAKLLNQFTDSEEQRKVAAVFNARIPLEGQKEMDMALTEIVGRMKKNSNAYHAAHLDPADLAGLQKTIARQKELEAFESGRIQLHISTN